MSVCLKKNRVQFYEVFHSYASRLDDTNDEDLLVVLVRGDIDATRHFWKKINDRRRNKLWVDSQPQTPFFC